MLGPGWRPKGPGTAYDVAPVEATHQAWVAPVVRSGPSSTPSSGSRRFWSRTYNKTKAGTIKSAPRAAATSTAVIVSDGAAACDTVSGSHFCSATSFAFSGRDDVRPVERPQPVLAAGARLRDARDRRWAGRDARVALAHGLSSRVPGREGVGDRGPINR
jgi:hypothetical protein